MVFKGIWWKANTLLQKLDFYRKMKTKKHYTLMVKTFFPNCQSEKFISFQINDKDVNKITIKS